MLCRLRTCLKNKKGQAMVELAVTLPIFILVLCGIIDFGWIITNQNSIDYSARAGARYATVNSSGADAVETIRDYTNALIPSRLSEGLNIEITFTNTANHTMGDVIVSVTGQVEALTPVTGIFTSGEEITLSSSCRMKVES
ncbi:MAG: TadE/TadG family type IV pilus assembly protein [Eubacteriales bacterium]